MDENKKKESTPASDEELLQMILSSTSKTESGSNAPLRHGRSLPLPPRVKSGLFKEACFTVDTASQTFEIAWDKVTAVFLGFVNERQDTESAAYVTEKMVGDMGRMVKGVKSGDDGKIVSFRESQVLDVIVEGFDEPLRFESDNLNYRAFLGRVSYMSFQNFFKFVHTFVSRAKGARFNDNVAKFLTWNRYEIKRCGAFYEHDEEVANCLSNLDSLLKWEDLDLSRTSWAQEWSD